MLKRNVNVDLFRVIATIFVIMLHVLGQGGVLRNATPHSVNYWVAWSLEILAYCAVNCFALISGYIMVNKRIRTKNVIHIWLQVLFYSLLFTVLFFIFFPKSRTVRNLVIAFFPIIGKQWWYVSSYFALFFFIPFVNKAIAHISQQTYNKLLIIIIIGICCLDRVFAVDAFALKSGYSAAWLLIVYLFGAYIRKYDVSQKITASKSALGFLCMVILTLISKAGIHFLTTLIFGKAKFENMLISYTSITILFSAVFLFLFCLNLKINHTVSKIVLFLSPAALGVYLIHVHPLVFKYIVKNMFASFAQKQLIPMLLSVFAATFFIFILCSAIELLRIQFFKLIGINKLCESLEDKLNILYLKVVNKSCSQV